jgi:preprotein translocase subunit YajC
MSQGSGGSGSLIVLLPLLLIGYMFISQRRRQRAAITRQQSIQVGDQIRTTSGLFGRVVALDDAVVTLEAAPGVYLRYDRRAVAGPVIPAGPSDDPGPSSSGPPSSGPADSSGPSSTPPPGR